MLYIYDKTTKQFIPSEETNFSTHGIWERQFIEKWVVEHPEILGEDLLIVTTECDQFDKTKERLDILALDREGKLVVIELKRDDSGRNVDLQAIKYAAYCSTFTMDDLVDLRRTFLGENSSPEEVRDSLFNFIQDDEFEDLDDKPRMILVAKSFRPEVTASVLWLRKFGLDISCIELTPYTIDDSRLGLVSSVLIPLPEAEDYIVRAERKEKIKSGLSRTEKEYIDFYTSLARMVGERLDIPLRKPGSKSWYSVLGGGSNIHYEFAFHGRPRSAFAVELHFEKPSRDANINVLHQLEPLKTEIEARTGEKVIVQEKWGSRWSRLYVQKDEGRVTDELKQWAVDAMVVFYEVFQPALEKLSEEE